LCGKVEDFFVFFFFFLSWVVSGGNKYQLQSLVVLKLWVNESFPLCIQEFVSLSCRT
jgi:hypothetical protein